MDPIMCFCMCFPTLVGDEVVNLCIGLHGVLCWDPWSLPGAKFMRRVLEVGVCYPLLLSVHEFDKYVSVVCDFG